MNKYDLIIVGAGASGLSAGVSALKSGIKSVLILEKEDVLGGNLNLFIDNGFGEYYLNNIVTGPELGSILIKDYKELGGEYKVNTRVLEINRDKIITYVNPNEGIQEVEANAIILAAGCREKYTGNIMIPIHKFTGIFTTGAAHRLVNYSGYLPGKEVIITGDDMWTFILARRLVIEGANLKGIVTERKCFNRDELDIVNGFNIPIIYTSEVIEIEGEERVNLAKVKNIETEEITSIECDSLILSVGYLPDNDFIRKMSLIMDGDRIYSENNKTSVEGIFITGTMEKGITDLFKSGENGFKVGKQVAKYLK
ncbi:NAD(P)/FAD-dependent oxidoreductase [uncultured Clostridium sp.]|uniref:NAD(P)/FAD-dependent oxidoreductase n=1 Tax=uncultured Clostridium sp. TaxID=59620 RepID=UPI0025E05CAF|nr:NAD(P)/FAD-dependent oxidoreductase [uncultured Clostridium sp.]